MAATDGLVGKVGVDGTVSSTPTGGCPVPSDEGVTALVSSTPRSAAAAAAGGTVEGVGETGPVLEEESTDWWARVRTSLSTARSLWRDFTGESAYDHYVERHRLEHPDHEPMGEREFWRDRARFDEDNVSTGCC